MAGRYVHLANHDGPSRPEVIGTHPDHPASSRCQAGVLPESRIMSENQKHPFFHADRGSHGPRGAARPLTRWGRLTAGAATAALLMLPAPAWAHDTLVSSDPGDGARVTEAPDEVEMTFSADVLDVGTEVRVTDSSGADLTDGDPVVDGTTVTQDLAAPEAEDETYTVVWRVVSSDGHPIEGTFSYELGEGAQGGADSASASADSGETGAGAGATEATTAEPTTGGEAEGEAIASPDETGDASDGAPLWLYAVGGGVLALVILGAVIAVRRIGGGNDSRR